MCKGVIFISTLLPFPFNLLSSLTGTKGLFKGSSVFSWLTILKYFIVESSQYGYRRIENSVVFVAEQITPKFCGSGIWELMGLVVLAHGLLWGCSQVLAWAAVIQRLNWARGFTSKVVRSRGWLNEVVGPGSSCRGPSSQGLLEYPQDMVADFPQRKWPCVLRPVTMPVLT